MTITELDKKIKVLEKALRDLRKEREEQIQKEQDAQKADAYKNALAATFDGIKFVADREKPFALALPMYVQANMFYSHEGTRFVCVKSGIADVGTLAEYLEADEPLQEM